MELNIFRKYGFNRQVRQSFEQMLAQLQAQHPNMNFFLPINNSLPYLDQSLQPVAVLPNQGLGSRLADVVSNTSKVCTSERHIVEQSFARAHDQKLSGNKYPVAHQLTEASGTQPTPELPAIGIWLDVMAVLRRLAKPYHLQYGLAPGVTYSDHGRDLLARLMKENVLCSSKGLIFNRPDLFNLVSNAEIRNGSVRMANLLAQNETELPILSVEELMGITLGPMTVKSSHGYLTGYHEEDVLVLQQGNYQTPGNFHHQAAQVDFLFKGKTRTVLFLFDLKWSSKLK